MGEELKRDGDGSQGTASPTTTGTASPTRDQQASPAGRLWSYAHLKSDSMWRAVFPDGMVPILNLLLPEQAEMQGDGVQEFYRVAVDELTADQVQRVAELVARQCGGEPAEVKEFMLKEKFLPLRGKHVDSVSADLRAFL